MGCSKKFMDNFLNRSFYKLGYIVGEHPGYFIIIPLLLACICFTGYQRIEYEIDPEYLFTPINGPGKIERAVVEQYFNVNYTHNFNLGRITRAGRFGHVIVTPKDGDPNLLRTAVWDELQLLDQIIRNATITFEDENYTFDKVCARWQNKCVENDILNLRHIIPQVESHELNLTFPLMFNPVTWDAHLFPIYFGGSVITKDLTITSVPSLQLAYFLIAGSKRQDAIGSTWEEKFLEVVGNAENGNMFKHIRVARFASRSLELELEANTKTVVPYFTSAFLFMAIFSVITCMMTDWVRSKPWLGFLGNLSAIAATAGAFGFCIYLGVDFIGLNLAAPFLMIGIGIDDTFVMLAAWRRTDFTSPVPLRMAETLSEAAVSVTITSLTNMVSFFIGIFTQFPSIQIFCIYSGFAVVFTFLFHLTFFTGCLAISGYCEQKNLHSVFCCKVQPLSKSSHRSWFYRVLCSGGIDPDNPCNLVDNPEHGCMSWFRDYLGAALNMKSVKALVIIIFAAYLAGACYGLTKIKEGLERRKLSKEDSYSVTFYDLQDQYFREFPYRVQVIVSGDYDYSDPVIQSQVENLTRTLEETKWISNSLYSESWLRSFLSYITENQDYLNVTIDSEENFIKTLKDYWLFPSSPFSLDVKFDDTGKRIIGSRFLIQAVNVSGTNQEKEMVRDLRKICHDSPLNASVFHPYFVFFDQFDLVIPISIQSMIIGAVAMMVITYIFIPDIMCCFLVALCIISIEVGVAGYMALWDVNLDSISMINLIMCIGFSIDFTAHICYAYMSSKFKTSEERVKACLYSLGLPVVQGAVSTILGLLALLFAGTYIFLVFFKMVFLVIFLGALHGLLLLPVLLSIFGTGSTNSDEDNDDDKKSKEDISKLTKPYVIPHPQLYYTSTKESPAISLTNFEERDPGLGTSEDSNSTESGSSQSRRRQQEKDEQKKAHEWRRSVGTLQGLSQFQANIAPPPDYPGAPGNSEAKNSANNPENNSLNIAAREYTRSRSQHNLHQPPRYFTEPRY
ncbi:patched domain-containing protein 3 isoform X1 [Leptopilina heterotoma]|uniref:patched domain-containing protein 3 isoform X1 n=1 Tax=Leptopilina heterotoma TaxID=63436 RepID=UPI001CA8ACCF|nr:patched domain-containing protein 3 isoform X1 [Leptopilina heterotoma]